MQLDSIVQRENEQTLKKIRKELYFLYSAELRDGVFTDELVDKIRTYISDRLDEEAAKMRWFPTVWSDDNVDQEFKVTVSVIMKSKREMTIRMSLSMIKAEQT